MKQAIILAGGKGTRLRERLGDLPKPLVDLCGVPLLERQILFLKSYGFKKILILVSYQSQYIKDYCLARGEWGLQIECIDDGEPKGTAGAVLGIFDKLDQEFLVMYGDTMLDVDIDRFLNYHRSIENIAATLFIHPNDHPQDSDLVDLDDNGMVKAFYPYPHDQSKFFPNLVNAALYWLNRDALIPWINDNRPLDFAKDLFPKMLDKGLLIRGYNSPEYIKDCGTPKRIDKVCSDFISGKIDRSSLKKLQKAVFMDRDGTINKEVKHLKSTAQFELLPGTEAAIKKLNKFEYRTCVITNQPVIARGECSFSTLREINNKLETLLGREGAFVDRIYFCPHHPDRGFPGEIPELKIECDCRKPKIKLIRKAEEELNISLRDSWFIGDTTTDILTAKRAGIRSVLVETGYAGMDGKYDQMPDYILPNLLSAVDFIIHHPKLIDFVSGLLANITFDRHIFVSGQSRSGKSTLASLIKEVVNSSGIDCHVISTDRWLLSEKDRGSGFLNRHDMFSLQEFVKSTKETKKIINLNLPFYKKQQRLNIKSSETITLKPHDLVLFEGVAVSNLSGINKANCFFVEIDEYERRKRVIDEYMLRGVSFENSQAIYQSRFNDEYQIIRSFGENCKKVDLSKILRTGSLDDYK